MSTIAKYPWWLQCVLLWLSAFMLLNIVGLVGAQFLEVDPTTLSGNNQSVALDKFPGIWKRWDAGYYLDIAIDGYAEHSTVAGFFPLYPMLVGFFHRISHVHPELLGVLISNISFLLSILFLYKIARLIKDEHTFAMQSVLAMLVFPTSFFYFAIYAESLYLLFAILGVYLVLRSSRSYVGSGLALGLSSIARPVGWLADVVMVIEFFKKRKFDIKEFLYLGIGLFFSVIGIFLYIYYLYIVFHTFLAIPDAQSHWLRHWGFPWIAYWEALKTLATPSLIQKDWFLYAMNALDLLLTGFAFVMIIISFLWAKRNEYPWSLSIYSMAALLFFLSSQNVLPVPLWGMSRWVASLFPLYIILGNMFVNKKFQIAYYCGSAMLLLFFTAWWTSGRWIG